MRENACSTVTDQLILNKHRLITKQQVVPLVYPDLLNLNGHRKEAMTWKALIIMKIRFKSGIECREKQLILAKGVGDWEGERCVYVKVLSLSYWVTSEKPLNIMKSVRALRKI